MKMGYSSSGPEAAKALYTISSLIRDNEHGQELFLSENGYAMLQVEKGNHILNIKAKARLKCTNALFVCSTYCQPQTLVFGFRKRLCLYWHI